jgi:hypothetical protein
MDDQEIRDRFPADATACSLYTSSETQPASYSMGLGFSPLVAKGPKREVDYSPPFTSEVKIVK